MKSAEKISIDFHAGSGWFMMVYWWSSSSIVMQLISKTLVVKLVDQHGVVKLADQGCLACRSFLKWTCFLITHSFILILRYIKIFWSYFILRSNSRH